MTLAGEGGGALLLILLMALVTLGTRLGGVYITGWIPLRPRVRSFIDAMSGSVLVAVLVPLALQADAAGRLAILSTLLLMLFTGRPMPAIAAGVAVAAGTRWLLG